MSRSHLVRTLGALACLTLLAACGDGNGNDDGGGTPTPTPTATASPGPATIAQVVDRYANILSAGYSNAAADAEALHDAVHEFVEAPSEATLAAAKQAWIDSRPSYQQTEVARFYDSPIDNPDDGPEGRINAWPLDEGYIDYVEGDPDAGIINDPVGFPEITEEAIAEANEAGGETNISTGYHAIEFLLWGQDGEGDFGGTRPFTDYVTDGTGTASNQERRGEYLLAVADLLASDIESVRDQWAPGQASNYRAELVSVDGKEALRRILTGIGTLGAGELAGERLSVAFETRDQEDEHSCFSDNTRSDLANDAVGIQNAYLGILDGNDGPGVDDLVAEVDATLAARIESEIAASVASFDEIPEPFDEAIQGTDDAPGRQAISATIDALLTQTDSIAEAAAALGVSIGTSL
jgi:putative iron-regulated protein